MNHLTSSDIRTSLIEFLGKIPWCNFATLTMGDSTWNASASAAGRYFKRWVRLLEQASQQKIRWFWSMEGGEGSKKRHLHVLLGGTGNLLPSWMESKWRVGNALVTGCDRPVDAAANLLKTMREEWDDYDIWSPSLRRRNIGPPLRQEFPSQTIGAQHQLLRKPSTSLLKSQDR